MTFTKHDKKVDSLADVALFRGCHRRELRKVAKITTPVHVAAGRVLCEEGEIGRQCFIVVDGEAAVTIAGEIVAWIGAGGFFGEMALLDGKPRVATVAAATDMQLLVLSRTEFAELLIEVPTVTRRILEAVAGRLRATDERLYTSWWNTGRTSLRRRRTCSRASVDPLREPGEVADGPLVELGVESRAVGRQQPARC